MRSIDFLVLEMQCLLNKNDTEIISSEIIQKMEGIMAQERRRANRMDINVTIQLNSVKNKGKLDDLKKEAFVVDVVNISKDGLAFKSSERLELNTYYDTTVLLWTKEKFQTVIEIVRMENYGEEETMYGCRFIGIMPSDQLKIQIYEMVSEKDS